ncbi:MAG: hypothetical protein AAF616_15780 [Bacteroidota bacterium]
MTKEKHPDLEEHFERLKELLPEVYGKHFKKERESKSQKLYNLLKMSLGVIEAVYLQNSAEFSRTKAETYGKIVLELREMGFEYDGSPALLNELTEKLIIHAKKPMERAKGIKSQNEGREAV